MAVSGLICTLWPGQFIVITLTPLKYDVSIPSLWESLLKGQWPLTNQLQFTSILFFIQLIQSHFNLLVCTIRIRTIHPFIRILISKNLFFTRYYLCFCFHCPCLSCIFANVNDCCRRVILKSWEIIIHISCYSSSFELLLFWPSNDLSPHFVFDP